VNEKQALDIPHITYNRHVKKGKIKDSSVQKDMKDTFSQEELYLIRAVFQSSSAIKKALENPFYSELLKMEIIKDIFPGLSLQTKSFLKILTEKNHLYLLPEISEEYKEILFKYKNLKKIKISTANPLDEKLGFPLLENLKILTKAKEIFLGIQYNPKLLGGFIVEFDSKAIDLSILKEFSSFFTKI
jgi:ATP synthase F1 delta subunit